MAKQEGVVHLKGKIGGIVFYKNQHGQLARSGWETSKEKVKRGKQYASRRDNNSEFGYSSRMGKLLRRGVTMCCPLVETTDTNYRLAALIRETVKGDLVRMRGQRRLAPDNTGMLSGFNWKAGAPLSTVLKTAYDIALDGGTGSATLDISELVTATQVQLGIGATHVEIVLVMTAADADADTWAAACAVSGKIGVNERTPMDINLSCELADVAGKVVMAGIGVQGYQEVNGKMMALREGNGFEVGMVVVG